MTRRHPNKLATRLARSYRASLIHAAGCALDTCCMRGTEAAAGLVDDYICAAERIGSTKRVRVPSRFRGELGTFWRVGMRRSDRDSMSQTEDDVI